MAVQDHTGFHRAMSERRRATIEEEIETHLQRVTLLIARLDRADAIHEDMEEDDHDGDPCDRGEPEPWRFEKFTMPMPAYGVDQDTLPTNHQDGERALYKYTRTH